MTDTCKHVYTTEDFAGNLVERPYTSIFCPDCGKRIEAPGPTRPFKLRPDQR